MLSSTDLYAREDQYDRAIPGFDKLPTIIVSGLQKHALLSMLSISSD